MACQFNEYFESVFIRDDGSTPQVRISSEQCLPELTITQDGILRLLL